MTTDHLDADRSAARRALLEKMLSERGLGIPTGPASGEEGHAASERLSGPIGLSPAQERVWFHHQLQPESTVHHLTAGVWLEGDLDDEALQSAVTRLVVEHPVLRTVYTDAEGEAAQREDPSLTVPVIVEDHTGEDHAREGHTRATDGELLNRARAVAQLPFDLRAMAPIRFHLLRQERRRSLLVVVVHHIAADDSSWAVLLPSLFQHYTSLHRGEAPSLDVRSHAEATALRRSRLDRQRIDMDLAYWRGVFDFPPSALRLPTVHQRADEQDESGADVTRSLSPTQLEELTSWGRTLGASPFMSAFAVFAALLHRVTGDADLIAGTPVSLREDSSLAELVGNFQNTLALRLSVEDTMTFRQLLEQVRDRSRAAWAHQELPFDELVADLRPPRSPGRNPLFDVMFLEQQSMLGAAAAPGLTLVEEPVHNGTSQFDLTFALTRSVEPELTVLYKTALYDEATVVQLIELFGRMLTAVLEAPDQPISALSLIGGHEEDEEWRQALPAASPASAEVTLPARFAAAAARDPGKTAVEDDHGSLTYQELDDRSRALARRLLDNGLREGSSVGVLLSEGCDIVTAILAVSRAGGTYVPIDPRYPVERIAWTLQDSSAPLLLTRAAAMPGHLGDGWDWTPNTLSVIDLDEPAVSCVGGSLPEVHPDSSAYVIYTSGSTGQPKGVVVSHRNAARLFDVASQEMPVHSEDVWSMCHSASFDFSVWEMWGALSTGGRLVVADRMLVRSPHDLHRLLVDRGVTILSLTPSAFHAYASCAISADFGAVRRIVLGGEELPPSRLTSWFGTEAMPRPDLVLMYGITETTVHVTHHRIRPSDLTRPGSPLGEPLADMSVTLVDTAGRPVPDGVVGEILVAGGGVSQGYLNSPERTRESFVPGSGIARGTSFYRSGDLGRRHADGTIEYLGRNDAQLEVRGHRVEPADVEAALATHPAVTQVGVTAEDDRLVAHVVLSPQAGVDAAALRRHASKAVPDYLVPSLVVAHSSDLPLTPNGKLDRRGLRSSQGTPLQAAPSSPPEDELQRTIAAAWSEELDLEAVGHSDNFFDLGGHSLLLARVRSTLSAALDQEIPIADLYAYPTVKQLAEHLTGQQAGPGLPSPRAQLRRRAATAGRARASRDGGQDERDQKGRPHHD
jgi:amino acid adenylation domain-containing protein